MTEDEQREMMQDVALMKSFEKGYRQGRKDVRDEIMKEYEDFAGPGENAEYLYGMRFAASIAERG